MSAMVIRANAVIAVEQIGEPLDDGTLRILGVGTARSRGIKKGVVVNLERTIQSIEEAVSEAEQAAEVEIGLEPFADEATAENNVVARSVRIVNEKIQEGHDVTCDEMPIEEAREMLSSVGLTAAEDRYPHELSGGQRQRVAIARALVNNPSIILADEPTGNLDPDLSLEVMRIFRRFNEVGVTLLIASHDIALIDRLGCRRSWCS